MAKRILPKIRRWPLWALILLIVLTAQKSSYQRVFTEIQEPYAWWEVTNVWNNRIGDAMKVKLTLVTSQGMVLDFSRMPDVGDVWELPAKDPPISPFDSLSSSYSSIYNHRNEGGLSLIDEGEVEVRSREMKQSVMGGKVVTVFTYEFQYLSPIDFEVMYDDKRLPGFVPITAHYLIYESNTRRVESRLAFVDFVSTTIYMYHRVDENSVPMFDTQYEMPVPESPWRHGETLGLTLIGLAAALLVWRSMLLIQSMLKTMLPDTDTEKLPTVADYFKSWEKEIRYETFIEAVKLFRKTHREKNNLWWKTTVVLYSGIVFDDRWVRNLFNEMLKEE